MIARLAIAGGALLIGTVFTAERPPLSPRRCGRR
jgi:hypothetical protein